MGEILNKDGAMALPGKECLFQLPSGAFLFSESVKDEGDSYVFDAKKTVHLIMAAPANGQQYQIIPIWKWTFGPTRVRLPKTSVLIVQDATDAGLFKAVRSALSGIILSSPGALGRQPGEKEN